MSQLAKLLAFFFLLAGCPAGWNDATNLEKPSPGYPCGTAWHLCASGACCKNSDACGGTPGCPEGICCFVGEDGMKRDAGDAAP
jgi:hypothetical protein